MLRSKMAVIGVIGALVVMTGVFTAMSSETSQRTASAGSFIAVNGHEIQRSDYVSRLATVEQNIVMLRAQAESSPDGGAGIQEVLDILEDTPAETIALASVILDAAIFHEAIERGHLPDPMMIDQQVQQERGMWEMIEADPAQFGIDEADVASYRDTIEEIGEERYWNEFFPQVMEQQIALQQFQMSTTQTGEDWLQIQRDALARADVRISDPDAIAPATVAGAEDYLLRVWAVYQ